MNTFSYQMRILKSHSTLIVLMIFMYNSIVVQITVNMLFFDFSKAFDAVYHSHYNSCPVTVFMAVIQRYPFLNA